MKITLPVWPLVALLVAGHLYVGVSYITGSPMQTSSGSFTVVKEWLTIQHWGWLIAITALGPMSIMIRRVIPSVILLIVSAVPLVAFAVGLHLARLVGLSQGVGGSVLFLIPAGLHIILAYGMMVQTRHQPDGLP